MFLFASVILVTQEMLSYLVQELPPHLQGFLNEWILVVLLRVEVTLSAKGEGMLLLVNVSLIISVIPTLPVVQNVPQMQSAPQTKHAKDCTVWKLLLLYLLHLHRHHDVLRTCRLFGGRFGLRPSMGGLQIGVQQTLHR